MLASVLLLALPFCSAKKASSYAGSTLVASPPPTDTTFDSYFPDASQVGYPGSTPTRKHISFVETNSADGPDRNFDVMRYWGDSSPQYSVKSFGLPDASPIIPEGYGLNAVHLLMRHGARYPSAGSGASQFAANINSAASNPGFNVSDDLEFLATWTYKLGAEILTSYGEGQLFSNGVAFRVRYGELVNALTTPPVFRTTSEDRMVDSTMNFAAGFFGLRTYETDYHLEIIIEASGFNNTLTPDETCSNAKTANIGEFGSTQASKWADVYLQAAQARFQKKIQGYNFTISDLISMQELCAYETVALGFSKFCDLFTKEEWEGYEYYVDLDFWYSDGPGNPTSAAQGLGYVQELVARLTQTPITVWNSTTNSTLDSSNITFPFIQPIYVDATHGGVIGNIVTALNFTSLAANGPLPTDHIPPNRSYIVSQIAPFASQLVAQVLSCPASEEPTHIRFILNDAVVPLTGVQGCVEDQDGLCALPDFISGMHQRIGQINFAYDCFANYTMPDPDNIIDGRYPG